MPLLRTSDSGRVVVNLSIKQVAEPVRTNIRLPLYYTGLTETALIAERGERPRMVPLDRRYG